MHDMGEHDTLKQRYSEFVEPAESESHFSIKVDSMSEGTRGQFLVDIKGAPVNAIMDKAIA